MCKVITIPSLVWLRRTVRRWRWRSRAAEASVVTLGGDAVPAGHVAVRVEGAGRFLVRLTHLNHPEFRELLRQAEEEYGFPSGASGPIALPCGEEHLREVLLRVSSDSEGRRSACCRGPVNHGVTARRGDSRPLLQEMAVEKLVW